MRNWRKGKLHFNLPVPAFLQHWHPDMLFLEHIPFVEILCNLVPKGTVFPNSLTRRALFNLLTRRVYYLPFTVIVVSIVPHLARWYLRTSKSNSCSLQSCCCCWRFLEPWDSNNKWPLTHKASQKRSSPMPSVGRESSIFISFHLPWAWGRPHSMQRQVMRD